MKTYTIRANYPEVHAGVIMQNDHRSGWQLVLGGGSRNKKARLFRRNPAEIRNGCCYEAHPVPVTDGIALAKPYHNSDQILVYVDTEHQASMDGVERSVGTWWFDREKSDTRLTINEWRQVLVRATEPRDWWGNQHDDRNIDWHDALIVMNVGDVIYAISPNKEEVWAKYESVEKGLVKL